MEYVQKQSSARRRMIDLFRRFITVVLVMALLYAVLWAYSVIFSLPPDPQRIVPAYHKAEIERLLKVRGLSRITTVEISRSGYRFELDGRWYKL